MRIDKNTKTMLNLNMMDSNVNALVTYFSNRTSDLNYLEAKLGFKQFNDLRSHILACKINYQNYLKLINNHTKQKLANEAANAIDNQIVLKSKG